MANMVIINGNLGKDPEFNEDDSRVVLTVATSSFYKKEKRTEWHRVYGFKSLVKSCKSLEKGRRVFIEGHLQTAKYGEEGNEKYELQVVADKIEF